MPCGSISRSCCSVPCTWNGRWNSRSIVELTGGRSGPSALEHLAKDEVRAGQQAVDAGDVGVDQQCIEQASSASAAKRIAVEQHDPRHLRWVVKCDPGGDRGAERMSHHQRVTEPEPVGNRLDQGHPLHERRVADALGVAERRQIYRYHTVVPTKQRPHLVPHPAWLGKAAQQHDRRSCVTPAAVGDRRRIDSDERSGVERRGWLLPAVGCPVVEEGCDGDEQCEGGDGDREPPKPTPPPWPAPGTVLIPYLQRHRPTTSVGSQRRRRRSEEGTPSSLRKGPGSLRRLPE